MDTDSKLINQGSYGCIYYPSLPFQLQQRDKKNPRRKKNSTTSDPTQENRSKYVSKLQKFNFHSDFEDHIGRKIQEIPSYELFFVPVLKTHKIDLATIKEKHVTGCDAIRKYIRRNVRDTSNGKDDDNDQRLTSQDYKVLNKNFIIQKMKYINGTYLHRYLLDAVKYSETPTSRDTVGSNRSSGSSGSSGSDSEASDDNTHETASKVQLTKTAFYLGMPHHTVRF